MNPEYTPCIQGSANIMAASLLLKLSLLSGLTIAFPQQNDELQACGAARYYPSRVSTLMPFKPYDSQRANQISIHATSRNSYALSSTGNEPSNAEMTAISRTCTRTSTTRAGSVCGLTDLKDAPMAALCTHQPLQGQDQAQQAAHR